MLSLVWWNCRSASSVQSATPDLSIEIYSDYDVDYNPSPVVGFVLVTIRVVFAPASSSNSDNMSKARMFE